MFSVEFRCSTKTILEFGTNYENCIAERNDETGRKEKMTKGVLSVPGVNATWEERETCV